MTQLFYFTNIFLFIVIVILVVLAFVVFKKSQRGISSTLFILFILSSIVWIFTNLVANLACIYRDINLVLWSKFSLLGPVFIPIILILFSNSFPKNKVTLNKTYIIVLSILTLGFLPFIPSRFNVELVEISDPVNCWFNFVPGIIYTFLILYLLVSISISLFILIRKSAKALDIEKLQIKFVIIGVITSLIGGIFINAFLPIIGYSKLVSLGPLTAIFFILFTTYAIVKHHLLNIRVITTELFVALISIVLLIETLTAKTLGEGIFSGIVFLAFLYLGLQLIRSVLKEIRRKEELKKMNLRLQELLAMKSEFLDIASHQLRTPLSAMIGLLSMQLEGDFNELSKEEQKKQQKNMLVSAERLGGIVNDLMDAMEVEGGVRLNLKPTQVEDLVQEAINTLKPDYEKKGLTLEYVTSPKPLPKIQADPTFLSQAFMNLIDNAQKYTEKGGVKIKLFPERDKIVFEIKDTGIGIKEEEKKKFFDKFIRGERATLVHPNGSGLGLFIVKKIVNSHKGEVILESKGEGKGTTFKVKLPINLKQNES